MKRYLLPLPRLYLPLLLGFLLGDEVCNNYIFQVFSLESHNLQLILYVAFLLTQIIAAPLQAGFSDFYCRKTSLVVSLSFSLLSLVLVIFFFKVTASIWVLVVIFLSKGLIGNTLPLSLAGVADAERKDKRLAMGLCTGAMASGYLVLIVLGKTLPIQQLPFPIIALFLILIFLCTIFFVDLRDKEGKPTDRALQGSSFRLFMKELKLIWIEIKLIKEELIQKKTLLALVIFLLWEISQCSIHMLDVDLRSKKFSNLTTAMVLGYLVGLLVLWGTKNKEDERVVKWGFAVCIGSVIPIFVTYPFLSETKVVLLSCYFLYNLGTVFLAPSLFSILAKERQAHEQGKIFGLLESTDTIAFLLASIIDIFYLKKEMNYILITTFSFLVFVLSLYFYNKFTFLKRG